MRTLSLQLLAETVVARRKARKLSQAQLAKETGISRSILSNLENGAYTPSVAQLEALAAALNFEPTEMFIEQGGEAVALDRTYKIAVAGVGYVGLSLAVLLAQHFLKSTCPRRKPESVCSISEPRRTAPPRTPTLTSLFSLFPQTMIPEPTVLTVPPWRTCCA